VEQSGKSHYKAMIVTPDKAFKVLMALPESERVLTLVIAATGPRRLSLFMSAKSV